MKPRFLLPLLLLTAATVAQAENWPQWRGPAHNLSSQETGLPEKFSPTENVKWKTQLPGPSGATPAVWGDSIFLTTPDQNKDLHLLCLSRQDRSIRWQKRVVEGGNVDKGKGNMASPSPITDGKTVWALFGTGHLAAFDFQGQELWRRDLGADYGKFAVMWIYGSSPLLHEGKLYIQVLQRSPAPAEYPGLAGFAGPRDSYLLALDPKTGKDIFRKVRPTDASMESMESYATPTPHVGTDGKTQILVVGGDVLTGHDPDTGAELWRGSGLNRKRGEWMRIVPSPVSLPGLALACGPKKEQAIAFRTDLTGDITEKGVAWTFDEKKTPDVCTPLYYQGKLFVLDGDSQTLTCLDPKTGAKLWQGQLPERGVIRSSPTAADGKIYIMNEKGTVFVCAAGPEFQVLSVNPMGDSEGSRSSIAISDRQLFIRTTQHLYCIAQP